MKFKFATAEEKHSIFSPIFSYTWDIIVHVTNLTFMFNNLNEHLKLCYEIFTGSTEIYKSVNLIICFQKRKSCSITRSFQLFTQ